MRVDYKKRLTPVIRYLEKHFNQPLNLPEVAALANLSPYHFHRTFKAVQGETLADYIRRLRLAAAADDLFKSKQPILNIALEYGFSSSQSLAKAFKQHYGVTPTEFRDCENYQEFSKLARNSKIGHTLRKNGNEGESGDPYTGSEPTMWSKTMEIQKFEATKLAYVRVTGPYGEGYQEPSSRLYQWAGMKGLAENTCIFIFHDNPEITPNDKCRTDICLMVPEGTEVPGNIELQDFPGGDYAVMRQKITEPTQYSKAWDDLMSNVINSGMENDDRPCFELYHSYDPVTQHSDVSFCTAIKQ
ncbi:MULTISPECIES: AraC family transcriptional regulator [Vibrio]|uniref:AraC family transcriptional regulator n=1 Tax=Vibrio TaxID=662 RepID=UPI0001B9424E|nr:MULTISPECIES: GyrI-like domain-containing protein [Vibrio]EEX32524.1 transcriptional regulator AraC family [Vibrio coralliilyticus ATCC BAA-450]MDE3897516.1 AraC family transcriptional regulator [Vibrio sp. CC007]QFT39176.1 Regulatory protein SoxS [Vibrio sp. THAF64]QGM36286.1 Regulatory protein SoxS [Vibrio sp. THAF191d]QGN71627.1 Regulatory protein SoxS [Vibrio sp. THAF191c]